MKELKLSDLKEAGTISELDFHFGRFMERLAGRDACPELALTSALVSATTRAGHICLDLSACPFPIPNPYAWIERLKGSGVVGSPGEFKPLVADKVGRVYLYRYWEYETTLAGWIDAQAREKPKLPDMLSLPLRLAKFFPAPAKGETDWQLVSACVSMMKKFAVISGGPGTGKTTTAAKILALLIEAAWPGPLRIALAAPTGKGAARLQSAIRHSKETLGCSDQIKEALPASASTIHRLLGPVEGSPYFRHNESNKLALDLLLIDEASMVDLALMSKLVQALPQCCRLTLLGDKDQLASVEAGAVLGDICNTGSSHAHSRPFCSQIEKATGYKVPGAERLPPVADCIVHLKKNYRFGSGGGIAALSSAVNQGDWSSGMALLKEAAAGEVTWRDLPPRSILRGALKEKVLEGFKAVFRLDDAQKIFEEFDRFRILCALREGPFGVTSVNTMVEEILRSEALVQGEGKWYSGRPVLIARNDYELGLFNGDVGIALPAPDDGGELRVFFPTPGGTMRKVHPLRLPEHETCYAMTVHKSQGSEFERALLILPDRDSPVLTRELVYTAVTRARSSVEIWGRPEIFRSAVERSTFRRSGLRDALWG